MHPRYVEDPMRPSSRRAPIRGLGRRHGNVLTSTHSGAATIPSMFQVRVRSRLAMVHAPGINDQARAAAAVTSLPPSTAAKVANACRASLRLGLVCAKQS